MCCHFGNASKLLLALQIAYKRKVDSLGRYALVWTLYVLEIV